MGEGSPDPGGLPHRWIVRAIIPTSSVFLLLAIVYVILSNLQILSAPQPQEESEELR
jgi:TRAP-type mannitol/chloroaromatic compound transport system permease small subunit